MIKCLALVKAPLENARHVLPSMSSILKRSLDASFYGSDYGKIESLLLGGSMGYTNDKSFGSDEGIKLISTDSKVLGTILGNVD